MIAKKVKLHINKDWTFLYEHPFCSRKIAIMIELYGMSYAFAGHFDVVDAAKFTIFMLQYPELIEKIVYENNCN